MRTGHLDDSAPAEYDARVFHVGALVPVAARGLDFLASARVEPPARRQAAPAPSGHTEEACLANTSDHAAFGSVLSASGELSALGRASGDEYSTCSVPGVARG